MDSKQQLVVFIILNIVVLLSFFVFLNSLGTETWRVVTSASGFGGLVLLELLMLRQMLFGKERK